MRSRKRRDKRERREEGTGKWLERVVGGGSEFPPSFEK